MKIAVAAVCALALAGCASTATVAPAPAAPSSPPPVMDPAAPGPSANAAYDWCLTEANRKSPSPGYTTYGRAYVRGFIKGCMVDLGADPNYTAVLLLN